MASAFVALRDAIARRLIRLGVAPNVLTVTGVILTCAAGICYVAGASHSFAWSLSPRAGASAWPLLAGVLLVLSWACDMLDGAVARLGAKASRFGAFLDSTTDRLSDFAVYAGIAVHYAWLDPANVTFAALAMVAFLAAFMISYARARAEDLIDHCSVGYWQRGERCSAILFATFAYNIPALLTQQALSPMLTAVRRVLYTRAVIAGKTPITDPRKGSWWLKIRLWRWARATIPYDLITAANIAYLIFAPIPPYDLLRDLFGG